MLSLSFALLLLINSPDEIRPELVQAVNRGLAYLAQQQEEDGSWAGDIGYKLNNDYAVINRFRGHVGVSSLACIAFMAGGHVPGRGPYGKVLERGLDWILSKVDEQGYIHSDDSRMYSHAFATLFLAEIYGMTQRPDVRDALQRSVDLVVKTQNREGGWRYEPYSPESDMSVVVCQVMALRAARNIGIFVPVNTINDAIHYVKRSAVKNDQVQQFNPALNIYGNERGSFRYQLQENSRSSFPLTAAGIATLHGAGIYSDEDIRFGVDYLRRSHDSFSYRWGNEEKGHYFFYYGHYYGVQAMYVVGGADWEAYWEKISNQLLEMQKSDGSWPNKTGPGTNFSTAVAALILEIPYRYLPIFQR